MSKDALAYVERFEPTVLLPEAMSLEAVGAQTLALFADADDAERYLLTQPQTDLPVVHHFCPGVYIREMHAPAGTMIVGHRHKYACTNILMQGSLMLAGPNGPTRLDAPALFVSEPGRKVAFTLSDIVFQNIIATDLTDVSEIESTFIEKSEQWLLAHSEGRI